MYILLKMLDLFPISTLFDKIIHYIIVYFIENFNFLNNEIVLFPEWKSPLDAILNLMDSTDNTLDNNHCISTSHISFDPSKAFDCIGHEEY